MRGSSPEGSSMRAMAIVSANRPCQLASCVPQSLYRIEPARPVRGYQPTKIPTRAANPTARVGRDGRFESAHGLTPVR
jgi:hypothetical protein